MRIVLCSVLAVIWLPVITTSEAVAQQKVDGAKSEPDSEPKHTNRLAKESSPYLLQHAHNPVDWFPWGEEAFAKAKRENKMVFLSVGYAACHWCHVMERESFEDAEIAALMNQKFVCVKVDREERPDVDQIYMTAVQMISGHGGWPMSVFLLPDGKPFWGGTYFPARTGDRGTSTGFDSIITQIDQAWQQQQDVVTKQAQHVTDAIAANQKPDAEPAGELSTAIVERVAKALSDQFDPQYGGFGYSASNDNQPKFPEPSNLIFLLDRMSRSSVDASQQEQAKMMLRKSLNGMVSGAMLDHLGGGFHRYSVDRRWLIPHFEKMLYDNGQLASVYAAAGSELDSDEYRDVAAGICDFVLRELLADGGAFYSALDADSEGEEGKFYRWTSEEIAKAKSEFAGVGEFAEAFHLGGKPNFEGEFFAPAPNESLTSLAAKRKQSYREMQQQFAAARQSLFVIRSSRIRPMTDVKILTAWNGLMIAGLADCGRLLNEPRYTKAAASAADFLLSELADDTRRLKRSYASGEAKLNAYVDDYAFLVSGLISLHRATGDAKWLAEARKITDRQIELFWDQESGGFYFTSSDHPALIVRTKDPVDGAIPSAGSVSAENLRYLAEHFPDANYDQRLVAMFQSMQPLFRQSPVAAPRMTAVLAAYLDATKSK
ncbi:MAG: thioredoxin domain-containing protein [Pirellulaceae bacterium]